VKGLSFGGHLVVAVCVSEWLRMHGWNSLSLAGLCCAFVALNVLDAISAPKKAAQ